MKIQYWRVRCAIETIFVTNQHYLVTAPWTIWHCAVNQFVYEYLACSSIDNYMLVHSNSMMAYVVIEYNNNENAIARGVLRLSASYQSEIVQLLNRFALFTCHTRSTNRLLVSCIQLNISRCKDMQSPRKPIGKSKNSHALMRLFNFGLIHQQIRICICVTRDPSLSSLTCTCHKNRKTTGLYASSFASYRSSKVLFTFNLKSCRHKVRMRQQRPD